MNILTTGYDEDVARMVFAEEYAEEKVAEKAVNFAKKLITYNRPIEEIIDCTGLTSAEINRLIAEN